jgi:CIC family chloride channel protein
MLRLLLGNDPLFKVPQYQLVSPWELSVYAVLGLLGGFVSVAFTKLLLRMREFFLGLPRKTLWFQPLVGGAEFLRLQRNREAGLEASAATSAEATA